MNTVIHSTLVKIAFVVSGIWLVFWLAKKISGTAFLVFLALTYIGYLALDCYLQNYASYAKLAYATAGRNERASQHMLTAACEATHQARWKFYAKLIGAVLLVVKFLPDLIHWLHHS